MKQESTASEYAVDRLYSKLAKESTSSAYFLNPEVDFTRSLIKSLIVSEGRYGYLACPCRLAEGIKDEDLDIICPCDYRDADLGQYGTCY
jgi:ferredoxin-thioredoxin reductase catalytic chain